MTSIYGKEYNEYIERLYNLYLDYYKKTGYHPHPANLLALKLLLKRNEFVGLKVDEGVFYEVYRETINRSIQELEEEFNITEEEISLYIEKKAYLLVMKIIIMIKFGMYMLKDLECFMQILCIHQKEIH